MVIESELVVCVQTLERMQPKIGGGESGGGGGGGEGSPMKRLEGLQLDGYLPTAKANLELTGALDKIKVLSLRVLCGCSMCRFAQDGLKGQGMGGGPGA